MHSPPSFSSEPDFRGIRSIPGSRTAGFRIPLRILTFDSGDRLVERYEYEDARLDAGLTDADFSPDNPAYRLK